MTTRIAKIAALLGLIAAFGLIPVTAEAGRTTKCWKCTGGWCCY